MLGIKSWIILLIFKTPCIFAVTNCLVKISEPRIIKDMISTQGHFCSIPVKVLNKENVTHYCDKLALIYEVDGLLEKLKFIRGSNNERDKNHLIEIYKSCIVYDDYNVLDTVSAYLQTENMSPIQILERVNNSLHKVDGFMADSTSSSECESYYKKNGHNNDNVNKEQLEGGRKKDHNESNLQLIIIVILVVLVLLLLCGFLYYMHQYRVLKRRLNISCELDLAKNPGAVLPEEREPLPIIECDIV